MTEEEGEKVVHYTTPHSFSTLFFLAQIKFLWHTLNYRNNNEWLKNKIFCAKEEAPCYLYIYVYVDIYVEVIW